MPYKNKEDALSNARKHSKDNYKNNGAKVRKQMSDFKNTLDGRVVIWRARAKKDNIEWDLSKDFIHSMPNICAYSKIPLTCVAKQPNTISLDRIDSNKGYTEDNVCFCTANINYMKRSMPKKQFIDLCKQIAENF